MPKYRKRPAVIEAIQWTGDNSDEILSFCNSVVIMQFAGLNSVMINTLEGDMEAKAGDWIIKGVKGEFYPCKDDIFKATYEPVEDDN